MSVKILLVDDDKEIVELINIYLQNEGYQVKKAYNGKDAIEIIDQEPLDLLVLDIMMPEVNGMEVLSHVRQTNATLPVIFVSAKSSDTDKIQALFQGADDYITKPFNPLEVVARIKSILRRQQNMTLVKDSSVIEVGPLIIKKESHEVTTISGKVIQLTALEFGILYLLASNLNRVFGADEIFKEVWNQDSGVSSKTVMVHVSHLRDKIEAATNGEKVVQTVWGVGYKIEG